MTNKDIATLIASAKARGLALDETDAGFTLTAKRVLKEEAPGTYSAMLAQEVLQDFAERLVTGGPSKTFAGFMLTDNAEASI